MWGRTAVVGDSVLLAFALALGFSEALEMILGRLAEWIGFAGLPIGLALGVWAARILNRWRTSDPLTRAQTRGITLTVTLVVVVALATQGVQGEWVGAGRLQPMATFPIMALVLAAALLGDALDDLARARQHVVLDMARIGTLAGIGIVLATIAHSDMGMFWAAVNTLTPFAVVVAVVAAACDLLASRRLRARERHAASISERMV